MSALDRIIKARAGLILSPAARFFATLAMGLELEESREIETMATDGSRILFNPDFVESMTDAEIRFVICHEVMHVADCHHTRRQSRDPGLWNVACDHVINNKLKPHVPGMPEGGLCDPQFANMTCEAVYAAIARGAPQGGSQGRPQSGQGQGQPGGVGAQGADPGRCGGVIDAPGDAAAIHAAELEAKTRVLQAAQAAKSAGSAPGFVAAMVDAIRAPEVDWSAVLRRFVDESSKRDYSWTRPNRRFISSGLYLPGSIPDGLGSLAIYIDVSGSIDMDALRAFLSETQGAVDDAQPDRVTVTQWNTREVLREEFQAGDMIKPTMKTGGGTDLSRMFDVEPIASAVLVFTDMCWSRPPVEPVAPVLWCRWGDSKREAPYGELIQL